MTEREIFLAALEIAGDADRAAYLDRVCEGNLALRAQVESLLSAHEQAGRFLEQSPAAIDETIDRTVVGTDDDAPDGGKSTGEDEFRRYLQPATRPGRLGRLGHYEIETILGRGAFGIVAKAFDEKLHRVVAIKMMSPELATTSPPRKRFLREARTAAAVRHENIVGIYAVEEEPIPYLVMEYIPGSTLQEYLDRHGPLDPEQVLLIGRQVASGLAAAHAVNLIHRDIKPSNILLEEGPVLRAKISDFGLARAMDDASLTSSGLIAGTPMYMAPEQARGETLDHRADLFSLGSVLYQAASGRPPFRAANTVAVLKRVCEDSPRSLDDVIPGIPDWLETIIFKLLAKDRNDRYQTAQEVADLLERCRRELEDNGKVTCVEARSGTAETQVFQAKKPTGTGAQKKPLGWLVGGVIAVAAVIGLVLMNGGKKRPDPDVTGAAGTATSASTTETPADATTTTGWQGWPADAPQPAIAPFDAAQAKKHQEEWAAYLKLPVEYTNSIGMKFRLIPPGEFLMGGTPEEIDAAIELTTGIQFWPRKIQSEGPQHKVVLTQPIYVGVTQVTQTQYEKVIGTNPSHFSAAGEGREMVVHLETGDHPVETVNWNDAAEFCARLSQRELLKPFYFRADDTVAPLDGTGYRLPTEAEWEHACRAGTTTWFWGGNEHQDLLMAGWAEPNSGIRTHPVGELKANPFGLFDVHGNVWEWVQDNWDPEAYSKFKENPAIDPYVPFSAASNRVARGGVFYDNPTLCRSSVRQAMHPNHRSFEFGFRVVLPVDAVKRALTLKSPGATGSSSSAKATWQGWPADAPVPAIAPFDAAQAKKHQEEWAAYLKLPVEYENSIGMKFRLIPPGEFLMGSTPEEIEAALKVAGGDETWRERINSEAPQHKVVLTKPVYVGVTEVTQAQYEKVMGSNPSHFAPMGMGKEAVAGLETGNHPVEIVSWYDAAEFCAKLSQQEQLKPFYFRAGETITPLDGTGYRLPSEAEWEFACRAGTTTRFWSGDEDQDLISAGWFGNNSGGRTHAAGEIKANPFGLSDVHGNVWEWVQDGWDPAFYGKSEVDTATDPSSPFFAGSRRVLRSGIWNDAASYCRSSNRNAHVPSLRSLLIGFRVSLVVDAVKAALTEKVPVTETNGAWQGWPADAPVPAIAPFDADQAKAHQEAWAKYLGVPVEYTNSIGMKFRLMPPGEFLMGSTPDEIEEALKFVGDVKVWQEHIESEAPQHPVILTQPIYLGVFEVTQAEYEKVMGVNPSHFAPMGNGKEAIAGLETAEHPVEMVSWNDAAEFCAKLSQQEKLKPYYFRAGETITPLDGTGYRLPSEAEWEFACRAGTATKYWTGDMDEDLVQAGWFDRNSGGRTHAAGELKANPFGLFDIHGNVWERVQDGWDATYYGQFSEKAAINPHSPFSAGSVGVIRGGNWQRAASTCRSSKRNDSGATFPDNRIGFRVSLSVDAVKAVLAAQAPVPVTTDGWHGWPADAPAPAIAPFDAEQAKAHQEAWAKYLGVPVEYENSIGMKFRLIPAGEFMMGSMPEEFEAALKMAKEDQSWREWINSEAPRHKVILTQPMYFGVTEVTQAEYEQVMGSNPSYFSPLGKGKDAVADLETGNHPVEMVSWNDAAEFSAKLSRQEKLNPFYFRSGEKSSPLQGTGYRLPTEAEWESACRAGTTTRFWSGDEDDDLVSAGWFNGNAGGRTHAVGELKVNPFGLYDIHGNVGEWVQDGWEPGFYGKFAGDAAINPSVPFSVGDRRALRGGSWNLLPSHCRSSRRDAPLSLTRHQYLGFRVALPVDAVRQLLKVTGPAIP